MHLSFSLLSKEQRCKACFPSVDAFLFVTLPALQSFSAKMTKHSKLHSKQDLGPKKNLAQVIGCKYWCSQKRVEGKLQRGGRWHGAGILLGKIGINWIAHRKSIFRCSPEQLRHAMSNEVSVASFEANELLGIRNVARKRSISKGSVLRFGHR